MEIISFVGIVAALILIILGSVRGYSLILLSTVAALLVAATGGVNVFENYANVYMGGVANMVLALFPIFLGGQMFGKMLEMSGLPMAVASGVFRKLGPASAVAAVYLATLAMSVGGIDVFVIIFTMYPLAAAFFKAAGISRSLIPACVLGGAVAMQTLPGMPINNIVLPANAFGTTPMAGFWMAIAGFAIVGGGNLWYLHRAGQKYIAKGEGFIPREGDTDDVDLNTEGLPNPFLLLIPMGIVVLLLNLIHWPAWAALFIGCVVLALMFWKRYEGFHKIVNTMAEGAKNSQSVIQTAAICGLASVVGAVPGYNLLLGLLEKASFGSPYIMLFVCIAVIAGFTGSATGGLAFVLDNFTDKLVAMGGNPEALTRIANISLPALGQVIFSASGGGAKSAEEIFRTDYKEFHIAGHNLAVSQVTCMDSDQLLQRKGEFLQLMSSLQKKQGFDMVILMITDVLLEGTQLLFVGDRDSIRQAFNVEDAEDVVFLPKVMSRKKQVIPMLSALWG